MRATTILALLLAAACGGKKKAGATDKPAPAASEFERIDYSAVAVAPVAVPWPAHKVSVRIEVPAWFKTPDVTQDYVNWNYSMNGPSVTVMEPELGGPTDLDSAVTQTTLGDKVLVDKAALPDGYVVTVTEPDHNYLLVQVWRHVSERWFSCETQQRATIPPATFDAERAWMRKLCESMHIEAQP